MFKESIYADDSTQHTNKNTCDAWRRCKRRLEGVTMNYRNIMAVSLLTGLCASCSLFQADEPVTTEFENDATDRVEVAATAKMFAPTRSISPSINLAPQPTLGSDTAKPPVVTKRRVEFVIGDEGAVTQMATASNSSSRQYTPDTGPIALAPSYPERPVPARGAFKSVVASDLGQPAKKISGQSGSEIWDYGTFRVFFQHEQVAFTKVW